MRFLFPFSIVPKGSRIIIYGAGEAGYDFYRQIKTSGYAELVLWVDRQYEWFRVLNLPVDSPDEIKSADFDYVVVTAERQEVFSSICGDLQEMKIEQERIIWQNDYTVHENRVYSYRDRNLDEECRNAVRVSPFKFIRDDRLDIVIRYLYAKDIHEHIENQIHRDMYKKFIDRQWGGQEPTENYISAYFSEYTVKRGVEAFDSAFADLVKSIEQDGFDRKYFVPVDKKGRLINGAHRIAAAMACEVDAWCLEYPFDGLYYECNERSLENMGFSVYEIGLIRDTHDKLRSAFMR